MSLYDTDTGPAKQTVVALFASRDDADHSVNRLLDLGLAAEDIGYLEPADLPRSKRRARRRPNWSAVGAVLGALLGGAMGAFVVGLPGLIGACVASAIGVGLGAYAGAVVGGFFTGDGGSEEPYFLEALRAGRVLVSADTLDHDGAVRATAVLLEGRALQVDSIEAGDIRAKVHHPAPTAQAA